MQFWQSTGDLPKYFARAAARYDRIPGHMYAIEVEGLKKVFGNVEAVAGIDLIVSEGEMFGFLGPNGAGKSTTTKILTTLLRPTAGTARVAGFDIVTHPHEVRLSIGVALQEAGLDTLATGREMLVLLARLQGLRGGQPHKRAAAMLDLVGLSDAADRRLGTYSGGMRRRLDLAGALIHGPKLLFLDEPTTGLDPASRHAIWEEVARLNREEGITVFLTTQYLEEADRLAERVAIIDHGRIVALGSPTELKSEIAADILTLAVPEESMDVAKEALTRLPGLKEIQSDTKELTLFVTGGSSAIASAVRLLHEVDVTVGSVKLSSPTLDEVFLRATGSRLEGAEQQQAETDGKKRGRKEAS
ncbi:MAG: ATP-binding cassette domain-containing protein [Actinomycetota bacterium]|nr:ATP-binding cassette domain-containing protein [Actinomycetota bacterium]